MENKNKKGSLADRIPHQVWLLISFAAAMALWTLLSVIPATSRAFPNVFKVLGSIKTMIDRGVLWNDISSSLISVVSGYALGFVIALPVAILVHSVTAWIFGLEIAKEGWYSAIMAPIFVSSACDSGLALLMVVLAAVRKAGVFDCGRELFANLARLLATFIAVDAFFIGCELLTTAYPGTEGASHVLGIMTSGATAPFFWFEILGGLLIPFVLLASAKRRERTGVVVAASALVMCGVFCNRVWLLFTSFTVTNVYGAPGISSGSTAARGADGFDRWALAGSYMPQPVEFAVVAAVVSFCILGIALLSKKLVAKA